MAYDQRLASRVREIIEEMGGATEMSMMGAYCFLRGGNMACGVTGERLMVRLGKPAAAKAISAPEIEPLHIGGGRTADAFVTIDPASVAEDAALRSWVLRGLAFADTLPAKPQRRR